MKNKIITIIQFILISTLTGCFDLDQYEFNDYNGIWYKQNFNNGLIKYSGGMATYSEKHRPIAIYNKEKNRTYFCFGGVNKNTSNLQVKVAFFDHNLSEFSDPSIILEKPSNDPHENPVISIDKDGYIFIFSNSHGNSGFSYIHKSKFPHDITIFKELNTVFESENRRFDFFSYMQVWYDENVGFMAFFTRYSWSSKRTLCFVRSQDGINWNNFQEIASIEEGSYHLSTYRNERLYVVFDFHPNGSKPGINMRSNLYAAYSDDFGKNWMAFKNSGILKMPIKNEINSTLIFHTNNIQKNTFIKDLVLDEKLNPIILFSISDRNFNATKPWYIISLRNGQVQLKYLGISDHDFDMGAMLIDDNILKIISSMNYKNKKSGGLINLITMDLRSFEIVEQNMIPFSNSNYYKAVMNYRKDFQFIWCDGNPDIPSNSELYYLTNEEVKKIESNMPE